MICNVISTGSQGNAVVLNDIILIDCGVPYKQVQPYVRALRLVLLTHIHGDHFNPATVRRLHQERPTLRFVCCEWMLPHLYGAGVPARLIDVVPFGAGLVYENSAVAVWAFPLFHDVENCGYKIHIDGKMAMYATDTGSMEGKNLDWLIMDK